jgi:hypothetical protein
MIKKVIKGMSRKQNIIEEKNKNECCGCGEKNKNECCGCGEENKNVDWIYNDTETFMNLKMLVKIV